ncbi:MAG TPA: glucose-1-phosphate adenylyltransferase, partial [Pirellulaceae bacterium]
MRDCTAVILAGGKGSRLEPLTSARAKPAVPFGGAYRIIDFVLSNCLNSGIKRLLVLTQYKAMSLDRHLDLGWRRYFCRELGESLDVVPPQQLLYETWYRGTADAVYQNIYNIEREARDYVLVLAGDHIYKMNYRAMLDAHLRLGADLTIAALRVSPSEATQFGVMSVDETGRLTGFDEKPTDPQTMPNDPNQCLASMGVYVFGTRLLFELLCEDAMNPESRHDFGRDIVPAMLAQGYRVFAYPFTDENRKAQAYWRDVGTLDAYFEANMDLIAVDPLLNMYDQTWPIRSYQPNFPPPKFVFNNREPDGRCGRAVDSIVCMGSILSGGYVERSIVGIDCRINSYAHVEDSILLDGVNVGRHARIRRAIIEKGVQIPAGITIGCDPDEDQRHG